MRRTDLYRETALNTTNIFGYTALMLAVEQQQIAAVRFLFTLNPSLDPRDQHGWNVVHLACHHATNTIGLDILNLVLQHIVNYSAPHQARLLANIVNRNYANVFQFALINHPDLFPQLSHIGLQNEAWKEDVLKLIKLKNRLLCLKFDESLDYFKSKGQPDNHLQTEFSSVIKNLYLQLKQAKCELLLSTDSIEMSLSRFKHDCEFALHQCDAYKSLFPQPAYSILSFLFPPDNFGARYQAFKKTMSRFLESEAYIMVVASPN